MPRRPWSRGYRAEVRSRSEDAAVRADVAADERTPVDVLDALAGDPEAEVRAAVVGNPLTPAATLLALAHDPDVAVRSDAVRAWWTRWGPDVADDAELRAAIARDPETPAGTLAVLAEDDDPQVRAEVLARLRPRTGEPGPEPELFRALGQAVNEEAREAAARHRATPEDVLRALADDPDEGVRRALASNEATPGDVLTVLATDDDVAVRAAAALRCPAPDVLEQLASDEAVRVRAAVAANTRTPTHALLALTEDPAVAVRRAAAGDVGTRAGLRRRHRAPLQVLEVLQDDADPGVRIAVALNEGATAEVLVFLADDPDEVVRRAVAARAAGAAARNVLLGDRGADIAPLPGDVLGRLSYVRDPGVLRRVAANPDTPTSALARLADSPDRNVQRDASLTLALRSFADGDAADLIRVKSLRARVWLAESRRIPADVLAAYSLDTAPEVRRAVAKNDRAPVRVVLDLLADDDAEVRSVAGETLAAMLTGDAKVTPPELDECVACDDATVRAAVAGRRHVRVSALLALADDPDDGVRAAVASAVAGRRLDEDDARALAAVASPEVRAAVAGNRTTSREVLAALADDEDPAVREAVAASPSAQPDDTEVPDAED